jgi:transposase InsO family protein
MLKTPARPPKASVQANDALEAQQPYHPNPLARNFRVGEPDRVRRSMSRKGDCWDNAVAETPSFGSLEYSRSTRQVTDDARVERRSVLLYAE